MEPLDENDLKHIVSAWKAPDAPEHLHQQVFGGERKPWWAWLLTGAIRVPVPAVAAIVLLLAWLAMGGRSGPDTEPTLRSAPAYVEPVSSPAGQTVTLADFQPPAEIEIKLVGALP